MASPIGLAIVLRIAYRRTAVRVGDEDLMIETAQMFLRTTIPSAARSRSVRSRYMEASILRWRSNF